MSLVVEGERSLCEAGPDGVGALVEESPPFDRRHHSLRPADRGRRVGVAEGEVNHLMPGLSQGSGIRDQGSGIRDQGSKVRVQESGVRSQGSGVRGQGSGIERLGAGIRD